MARAQLLFRPSETFKFRLIADYNKLYDRCCYAVLANLIDRRVDGTPLPRPFLTRAAQLGYTPPPIDPAARRNHLGIEALGSEDLRLGVFRRARGLFAEAIELVLQHGDVLD